MQYRWLSHAFLVFGGAASSITAGSSCALDPVHDSSVKALGDEDGEFPPGPYHRAGQACTVCHGGQGPAKSTFFMAGTIFMSPGTRDEAGRVAQKAEIRIRDANNPMYYKCVRANCRGNFYVTSREFPSGITFPVKVSVSQGTQERVMNSLIGREPSCGACHKRPGFFDSPGQVYLYTSESEVPQTEEEECNPSTPEPERDCE